MQVQREAGSGKREAGSRLSRWGGGLLLVLIFGIGILGATEYELSVSLDRIAHSPHPGLAYQPSHERTQGPELVLLFAGSSTCGYSNDPDLPEVIEALKLELAAHAEEQGASFRAVGVAVDWIPEAGLEHLATFGAFDELSVGSNWTNHTLVRHTWDQGHTPATPAVFIIERTLVAEDGPGGLVRWAIDDTRVLLWRSGIDEIRTLTALPVSRYLGEFGAAGDADQGSEDLRPNSEGALPGGDPSAGTPPRTGVLRSGTRSIVRPGAEDTGGGTMKHLIRFCLGASVALTMGFGAGQLMAPASVSAAAGSNCPQMLCSTGAVPAMDSANDRRIQ